MCGGGGGGEGRPAPPHLDVSFHVRSKEGGTWRQRGARGGAKASPPSLGGRGDGCERGNAWSSSKRITAAARPSCPQGGGEGGSKLKPSGGGCGGARLLGSSAARVLSPRRLLPREGGVQRGQPLAGTLRGGKLGWAGREAHGQHQGGGEKGAQNGQAP